MTEASTRPLNRKIKVVNIIPTYTPRISINKNKAADKVVQVYFPENEDIHIFFKRLIPRLSVFSMLSKILCRW